MDKILLTLEVPITEQQFEILVPVNKKVKRLASLLNQAINELTEGVYPIKDNALIINKDTGEILQAETIIKDAGLKQGTSILFV